MNRWSPYFLGALSNSDLDVRLYSEGGALAQPKTVTGDLMKEYLVAIYLPDNYDPSRGRSDGPRYRRAQRGDGCCSWQDFRRRSDLGQEREARFAYARRTTILCISLLLSLTSSAQQKPSPLSPYVKEDARVLVLEHVRLIDGTGSAPKEDMRIDIAGGKITAVQAASAHSPYPANAKVLDMTGKTVIPGLVGMHEHLLYPTPQQPQGGVAFYGEAPDSAPRLYLAGGVTTARTAGSVEPYTDLELKRKIDAGLLPGPKLDVTGPYLEGKGSFAVQMHALADADDAARTVDY